MLRSFADGDEAAPERLVEIAATVAPRLSIPRGPKISAASACHEIFLKEASSVTGVQGCTWNAYKDDFSDLLTQATRREFDEPRFQPRAASRRSAPCVR